MACCSIVGQALLFVSHTELSVLILAHPLRHEIINKQPSARNIQTYFGEWNS